MNQQAMPSSERVATSPPRELVVWRFIDGKPGHEAQSQGLIDAIGRLRATKVFEIRPNSQKPQLFDWVRSRFREGSGLSAPDFLIGAGHATHGSMLAARRAYGGRIIVLMRPSLPLGWFDRCVIPEHDKPPLRRNIITTCGVLNPITYEPKKDPEKGLILVGGVSRHFDWDENLLRQQLDRLIRAIPDVAWLLSSSRRTPASTLKMLSLLDGTRLKFVPHTDTPRSWVPEEMSNAAQIWVTADSVSMLYEARTACGQVGVLRPSCEAGKTRVAQSVEEMIGKRRVATLDEIESRIDWRDTSGQVLAEADRVAKALLESFPNWK